MESNNQIKKDLLGMPIGTATNRLRKQLLFSFAWQLGLRDCYRCEQPIDEIDDFSIEHKRSWQYANDPKQAFFDLSNIAFSHLKCNVQAARSTNFKHNKFGYQKGCRCDLCKEAHRLSMQGWRKKG